MGPPAGPPASAPDGSVWEEPALSVELAGEVPPGAPTYAAWLSAARSRTPVSVTWLVTVAVAATAGPWAVIGAFLSGHQSESLILLVVVFGPLAEEILKVSAPLLVVELRPFLFRSRLQIGLCALLSGLVFAAIENALYLHVYVTDPSPELALWRWTVCVTLHAGCSSIAGLGVIRIWQRTFERGERPQIGRAFPALITATVIHAVYNGASTVRAVLETSTRF